MDILIYILLGIFALVLIFCLSIATYADSQLLEVFKKTNNVMSSSFTVASDFASMSSKAFLNGEVKVEKKQGFLTDAYSPKQKTIFLSEQIYSNSSVAALAIAGHEMGHALQNFFKPKVLLKKTKLSRISKILGYFTFPIFLLGIFFLIFLHENLVLCLSCFILALIFFCFALFVKLLTISIEKEASKNAIDMLKKLRVLEDDEIKKAKLLLNAALLTYVADFLRSILSWTLLTRKTKIFGG